LLAWLVCLFVWLVLFAWLKFNWGLICAIQSWCYYCFIWMYVCSVFHKYLYSLIILALTLLTWWLFYNL
jgi:hypothetical protein